MRYSILVAIIAITLQTSAQYGNFDTKALAAAKANTTLVVLDDGNTSYNKAIMNAVKAEWKFTKSFDFINTADLATQPIDPTKNYLMKILRKDADKHDAVFLALIQGWKQKKGEAIEVTDGAAANIAGTQQGGVLPAVPAQCSRRERPLWCGGWSAGLALPRTQTTWCRCW